MAPHPQLINSGDLPEYPLSADERLDSHYFMAWERRRWLNSDMRLKGTAECRCYYFDLINIAYDQSPVGTLPLDRAVLAKLCHVDPSHFEALCRLDYGPLHRWTPCLCDGEVRLMHPFVLKTLLEALARKEDHRARSEAGNIRQRRGRLRKTLAGYHAELAKNDAAVIWIDEWLVGEGCDYRTAEWLERAMQAWSDHMFTLNRRGRSTA